MGHRSAIARWLWAAAVVTAAAAAVLSAVSYHAEAGSRAGAEPPMAALFYAVPLAVLLGIEVVAAVCAHDEDGADPGACLAVATLFAGAVSALAVWISALHLDRGYAWYPDLVWVPLLLVALLAPLAGGWAAWARTRRPATHHATGRLGA